MVRRYAQGIPNVWELEYNLLNVWAVSELQTWYIEFYLTIENTFEFLEQEKLTFESTFEFSEFYALVIVIRKKTSRIKWNKIWQGIGIISIILIRFWISTCVLDFNWEKCEQSKKAHNGENYQGLHWIITGRIFYGVTGFLWFNNFDIYILQSTLVNR